MEPSTILGALIGGYINKVLPAWMTTVLLGLLLTFITYKLVVRGVITWRHESEEKHDEEHQRQPLLDHDESSESDQAPSGEPINTIWRLSLFVVNFTPRIVQAFPSECL